MISVIIPTYNEQENIASLVTYLKNNSKQDEIEILVCDGGSLDLTLKSAANAGAMAILSPKKGRAAQMNYGALMAKGDILYFVHADTFPAISFVSDINRAIAKGYGLGRYRTKFAGNKLLLKFNAFFTRFDIFMCYGGDQTLFIKTDLFNTLNGFDSTMLIMEDYEITTRAKLKHKYKIIQKDALVSARKYDTNSWLKVQMANYAIIKMYKKGATQMQMVNRYKKMLQYR